MDHQVRMYSRERCGLCDAAREVILSVRAAGSFDFEEIFIEGDQALEGEYGLRVPVVLVDGVEQFEVEVRAEQLLSLVGSSPGA